MIDAGAFPHNDDSCQLEWRPPTSTSPKQLEILTHFQDAGLVHKLPGNAWGMTQLGFSTLRRSRGTHGHRHVFNRREHFALPDIHTWELLDLMEEQGWQLCPHVWRQKLPPLKLDKTKAIIDKIHFPRKVEVSRDYVLCLAQNQQLAIKGCDELKQKQPISYYHNLIGVLHPDRQLKALGNLEQDDVLEALPAPSPEISADVPDDNVQPMLAICDQPIEGSLDSEDEVQPAAAAGEASGSGQSLAPPEALIKFGPFTLRFVDTVQNATGKIERKIVCRCPFHKDPTDASGTFCSKAGTYKSIEDRERLTAQLMSWCSAGQHKANRALLQATSHKGVDPRALPVVDRSQLESDLRRALASPHWIVGDGNGDDGSSGDNWSSDDE